MKRYTLRTALLALVMALLFTGGALASDSKGVAPHLPLTARARIELMAKGGLVSSVKFKSSSISLTLTGQNRPRQVDLMSRVTIKPASAENKALAWSSSNEYVASVDPETGALLVKNEGSARITATATDGSNRSGSVKITAKAVRVKSIEVAGGGIYTLDAGMNGQSLIGASVKPANATYPELSYASDRPDVASVDEQGRVSTHASGVATVTVSADGGKKTKNVSVRVRSQNPRSFTLSAVGDIVMGDDPRRYSDEKKSTFYRNFNRHVAEGRNVFENARPYFNKTDLTIANLEVTLTNRNSNLRKTLAFRGKPSTANHIAAGGVNFLNLANNHTIDYGDSGYNDTKNALKRAGVGYNGFNYSGSTVQTINGIEVGMIGFVTGPYGATNSSIKRDVKKLKARCDVVVVSIHFTDLPMGTSQTKSAQKSHSRAAIDAGADVVLGHHQAMIGGLEIYKGKYIAYGLGTFVSAGKNPNLGKLTFIFQQKFLVHEGFAESADLTVVPFWASSVKTENDVMPTKPSLADQETIVSRIRKYSTSKQIQFEVVY